MHVLQLIFLIVAHLIRNMQTCFVNEKWSFGDVADGPVTKQPKIHLTRYLIEPYASNIFMLWLFMCGVWRKKEINNESINGGETLHFQTFSRLVNIWLIYFHLISLLFLCSRKNETSSPNWKRCSFLCYCISSWKVVPVLPKCAPQTLWRHTKIMKS